MSLGPALLHPCSWGDPGAWVGGVPFPTQSGTSGPVLTEFTQGSACPEQEVCVCLLVPMDPSILGRVCGLCLSSRPSSK